MPDLRELPLDRFLNYVWWSIVKDADPNQVQKVKATLWRPPPGQEPDERSPWSRENELESFNALRAQLGALPKPTGKRGS